jgi:sec-independent protein translocase protein TatB
MFDIGYSELLVIAVVALIVIGPKDLPNVMRTVGQWVGRARGMARHFRSGIDTMMREAELEEMEKKWREENERIMRDHPLTDWESAATALPPPPETPAAEADLPPPAAPATPPPPEGEMPPPRADDDPRALP